jgi:hypothetical protein
MAFEVAFSDLRRVVNRLLDHAQEKLGSDVIVVQQDMYWDVPEDWRYNVASPPGQLDIGSLYTDWDILRKLVDLEQEPVSLLLDELAPLLAYIGLQVRE